MVLFAGGEQLPLPDEGCASDAREVFLTLRPFEDTGGASSHFTAEGRSGCYGRKQALHEVIICETGRMRKATEYNSAFVCPW